MSRVSSYATSAGAQIEPIRSASVPRTLSCACSGAVHSPAYVFCPMCRLHLTDPGIGRLASPLRRLVASIIDTVVGGVTLVVAGFFMPMMGDPLGAATFAGVAFLPLAIRVAQLYGEGKTIGKSVCSVSVIRADGETAGRSRMIGRQWLAKPLAACTFFLGFLAILPDRNRQGWHDKLAGTFVVED